MMSSNIVSIITLIIVAIGVGVLSWLTITGKVKIGEAEKICQPAPIAQFNPPAGIVLKDRAVITIEEGRFSIALKPGQKVVYLRGPIITLVVNSIARHSHNFVVAYDSGNCRGEALRRLTDILGTVDNTLRLSLSPGEYVLYCDLKDGARTHREKGEELKLVVY
jgi:hypothetical protein